MPSTRSSFMPSRRSSGQRLSNPKSQIVKTPNNKLVKSSSSLSSEKAKPEKSRPLKAGRKLSENLDTDLPGSPKHINEKQATTVRQKSKKETVKEKSSDFCVKTEKTNLSRDVSLPNYEDGTGRKFQKLTKTDKKSMSNISSEKDLNKEDLSESQKENAKHQSLTLLSDSKVKGKKRGRPPKEAKTEEKKISEVDKLVSDESVIQKEDLSAVKPEQSNSSADDFSPRRSGRAVVPNRRYLDSEEDHMVKKKPKKEVTAKKLEKKELKFSPGWSVKSQRKSTEKIGSQIKIKEKTRLPLKTYKDESENDKAISDDENIKQDENSVRVRTINLSKNEVMKSDLQSKEKTMPVCNLYFKKISEVVSQIKPAEQPDGCKGDIHSSFTKSVHSAADTSKELVPTKDIPHTDNENCVEKDTSCQHQDVNSACNSSVSSFSKPADTNDDSSLTTSFQTAENKSLRDGKEHINSEYAADIVNISAVKTRKAASNDDIETSTSDDSKPSSSVADVTKIPTPVQEDISGHNHTQQSTKELTNKKNEIKEIPVAHGGKENVPDITSTSISNTDEKSSSSVGTMMTKRPVVHIRSSSGIRSPPEIQTQTIYKVNLDGTSTRTVIIMDAACSPCKGKSLLKQSKSKRNIETQSNNEANEKELSDYSEQKELKSGTSSSHVPAEMVTSDVKEFTEANNQNTRLVENPCSLLSSTVDTHGFHSAVRKVQKPTTKQITSDNMPPLTKIVPVQAKSNTMKTIQSSVNSEAKLDDSVLETQDPRMLMMDASTKRAVASILSLESGITFSPSAVNSQTDSTTCSAPTSKDNLVDLLPKAISSSNNLITHTSETPCSDTVTIHSSEIPSSNTLTIHTTETPSSNTMTVHPSGISSSYTPIIHNSETSSLSTLTIHASETPSLNAQTIRTCVGESLSSGIPQMNVISAESKNITSISSTDVVDGSECANSDFTSLWSDILETSSVAAVQISDITDLDQNKSKYVTSSTQTPIESTEEKIILPSAYKSMIDVSQIKKECDYDEDVNGDKNKQTLVVVQLPEGAVVTQPVVQSRYKYDDTPFLDQNYADIFRCKICCYETKKKANWYKHKQKHLGLRPHACNQCQYRAATASNLKRHLAIHADIRNFMCQLCGMYFRQKIHLERHIKYKHEEKQVKCPLCEYICANENPDLKVHIKRKHFTGEVMESTLKAFTCPECSLIALSKKDLRQHMKFHKQGPELKLFCEYCSFVTDCDSRLRRHMFIHTKEKPFQCGLCEYRGSQKEHVLRHMRNVHDIQIHRRQRKHTANNQLVEGGQISMSALSKLIDRNDYTCRDKIFACNHCSMKFSKLLNLYKHLYTQHENIMPPQKDDEFGCVVCEFQTNTKKNLLVHMRKHNMHDHNPPTHVYSCVLCRYQNPKRRNLFQHMKKKHHIEIVMKEDGTTSCFIEDSSSLPDDLDQNLMNVGNIVTTTTSNFDSEGDDAEYRNVISIQNFSSMVTPQPTAINNGDGNLIIDTEISSTQDIHTCHTDAAEAIEGLQALSQQSRLSGSVEMMGSDEQFIALLDQPAATKSEEGSPEGLSPDKQSIQLTADQLVSLSSGDYVEINGEVYKVEISAENKQHAIEAENIELEEVPCVD